MARRKETSSTIGRVRSLLALACAAAAVVGGAHAFVVGGARSSGSNQQQQRRQWLRSTTQAAGERQDGSGGGGVNGLYTNEPADPNRRVLKLAFLATSRPKGPPKTEKEKSLDKHVWGRWQLVVRASGV